MLLRRTRALFQRFYLLGVFKGLWITLRHVFGRKVTISYPEVKRAYSSRFRGQHYIKSVNGVENCTSCMLCPTVCPALCIHIEAAEGDSKEKYPRKFEIDLLRCIFCGMCEEACPEDAIKLSTIYEMAVSKRTVYDKTFLDIQRGNK
jgi:NADH-quinone oxidoreductase subunit I